MKHNIFKSLLLTIIVLGFVVQSKAQKIDSLYYVYAHTKDNKTKDLSAHKIISMINGRTYNGYDTLHAENVLEIATKYNNDSLIAMSYFGLGQIASLTADYNKALAFNYKGLPYFEKINDTLNISFIYKEIGLNYKNLQNYDEALRYYEKAIKLLNTLNLDKNERWINSMNYYQGLARIYLEKHNVDSAFVKLQFSYNIFIKHEKDKKGSFQNRLVRADYGLRFNFLYANLNLQKKDTTVAEAYFKNCFNENPDSLQYGLSYYIDACLLYSTLKQSQGNYKNAVYYANRTFQIGLNCHNKKFVRDASEQLFKIYNETRQTDSAFFYLKNYYIYNDSINNAKVQSEIQNTTLLLHTDEIDRDARQANEQLKHKHNVEYAATAIGIIILLLLFFLFSHSIIVGTKTIEFVGTIALLMVFEFINLYIHPYLGKWFNESPIFMLLALMLIAALLIPLHSRTERWTKNKLIEKNKKIRLAHAKKTIHELENSD